MLFRSGLAALLASCSSKSPAAPAASPAPSAVGPSASASLDALDTRTPLPLLPMTAQHQKQNMRDHLVAVQEIVTALASDDFAGVERAAGRIGFSDEEAQMCGHMGAGGPGFTEQALAFHHQADKIAAAARDKDRTRVATELGATLKACTACHAIWKQQVVDAATWQRLTAGAPPMQHMH